MQQGEFYFMAVGSFITVGVLGLGMWLDYLTGERIRTSLKESRKLKPNQDKITWNKFIWSDHSTYPDLGKAVLIKFKDGDIGIGTINPEIVTYFHMPNSPESKKILEWAELPTKTN